MGTLAPCPPSEGHSNSGGAGGGGLSHGLSPCGPSGPVLEQLQLLHRPFILNPQSPKGQWHQNTHQGHRPEGVAAQTGTRVRHTFSTLNAQHTHTHAHARPPTRTRSGNTHTPCTHSAPYTHMLRKHTCSGNTHTHTHNVRRHPLSTSHNCNF